MRRSFAVTSQRLSQVTIAMLVALATISPRPRQRNRFTKRLPARRRRARRAAGRARPAASRQRRRRRPRRRARRRCVALHLSDRSRGVLRREAGERQPQPAPQAVPALGREGRWSFETDEAGVVSEQPRAAAHSLRGRRRGTPKIFEIVFEGDSFVTDAMRRDSAFSVRPIADGAVTERIVLK